MRRRAITCLLAGLTTATAALALGPTPVRAESPGADPAAPPSSDPAPAPSPSVSPAPSPSVDPPPTPSSAPSVEPPTPSPMPSPSLSIKEPDEAGTPPGATPAADGDRGRGVVRRSVAQAGGTASVAAVDDAFRPTPITVTVGTTVVWSNEGQNPHTVTANDRAFDSGTLESGQAFSITFDRVGEVPYYCQIHGEPGSGMRGLVIVRAAPEEGSEEEGEVPPAAGPNDLAATGADPIWLIVLTLASAIVGIGALRAARGVRRGRG